MAGRSIVPASLGLEVKISRPVSREITGRPAGQLVVTNWRGKAEPPLYVVV